ncbi:glycerophosphoryl diester phosphodiesterase [Gleimia sp. 6138-11-ORH1]|uniref:glycerophosphodiester phosphodiesterase family protein n=1 Tax=Gleimia sp. 6138-11-ORH1 TaxID=2973937 RepID=UPI002166FE32|nr:glycerophosphodiester phosphodiesterase family protein [Gleimia sp. 6138-11-ORH1]MCS4484782.1 glycerophosphoryl diester phosphodiesterase [Gleimia sp. 6138-11-ORH1]
MSHYPKIIAHRGMSALAPENTMAAFASCIDYGVKCFEFDVDIIGDGSLICIHDDKLDRTTNGKGGYYNLDFSAIRKLDAGKWFDEKYTFERIPELASVIELMNKSQLDANLEIKPCLGGTVLREKLIERIAVALQQLDPKRGLVISSFDAELLLMAGKAMPERRFAGLAPIEPDVPVMEQVQVWLETAEKFKETGATIEALHVENDGLTAQAVAALHEAGYQVRVWTVNDLERAAELAKWGVDAIFTDNAHLFPEADRAVSAF